MASVRDNSTSPAFLQWRCAHLACATLESSRRSSIILAAFSFTVFTSLQMNFYPTQCPGWLIAWLAINSALLVSMHTFAFLVGTFLLPKLQAVTKEYQPLVPGQSLILVPDFSPHERFKGLLALSYNISHVLGLLLFILEIALICWVKFYDISITACITSSAIVAPFILLFCAFCWYFHRILHGHVYHTRTRLLSQVRRDYTTSEQAVSELNTDENTKSTTESITEENKRNTPLPQRRGIYNRAFVASTEDLDRIERIG